MGKTRLNEKSVKLMLRRATKLKFRSLHAPDVLALARIKRNGMLLFRNLHWAGFLPQSHA